MSFIYMFLFLLKALTGFPFGVPLWLAEASIIACVTIPMIITQYLGIDAYRPSNFDFPNERNARIKSIILIVVMSALCCLILPVFYQTDVLALKWRAVAIPMFIFMILILDVEGAAINTWMRRYKHCL